MKIADHDSISTQMRYESRMAPSASLQSPVFILTTTHVRLRGASTTWSQRSGPVSRLHPDHDLCWGQVRYERRMARSAPLQVSVFIQTMIHVPHK